MTQDEEQLQILTRLKKLSERPPNPGMAYRNLELIHDLLEKLEGKLFPNGHGPVEVAEFDS
jgi:hypothetical protein